MVREKVIKLVNTIEDLFIVWVFFIKLRESKAGTKDLCPCFTGIEEYSQNVKYTLMFNKFEITEIVHPMVSIWYVDTK